MLNTTSSPARELMLEDLLKSGLQPNDIGARVAESPERALCNIPHSVQGYVIPYFNSSGMPFPFYRVRNFDHEPKYKQPKETPTHVYFPPRFKERAQTNYIIITEGEKKAALAMKMGFPCVALGGVDAWRNRTLAFPEGEEMFSAGKKVHIKLSAGTTVDEDMQGSLAMGMQELIDHVINTKKHIIILFDSDGIDGVKPSVQRAAAALGFELRFRGVAFDRIRQLVLPTISVQSDNEHLAVDGPKVGLDDYLLSGQGGFQRLVEDCIAKRSAFPRHPNIRDYINKRLQRARLSRKEMQAVAMAILSELDSEGIRLRSRQEQQTFYFDMQSRKLFRSEFDVRRKIYDNAFGQFMYKRFGLGAADSRLFEWIAAQFTGEEPVEDVTPHRIIARKKTTDDCVYYQVTQAQFVKVDKGGVTLHYNGDESILFESDLVEDLDIKLLTSEYIRQEKAQPPITALPFYWRDVLSEVRLKDQNRQKLITALLYYMSPWLYRWRGSQLPVEMVLGESGSGKSTLCELRLNILTGQAKLRNAPQDLRDWHASIANTGALHVTDNVQLIDRNLRNKLSDEICRIITEPHPHIEMRKLYSNAELVQIPISCVFALTAIQQPFMNADLIQRSIILDLDKLASTELGTRPDIKYDAEWKANQLAHFGGREGWVAHQLLVLNHFFRLVEKKWDVNYQAQHRLINYEQTLMLMAEVFGLERDWIPAYLASTVDKSLTESDWTFEGIKTFCDQAGRWHPKGFDARVISDWATGQDGFEKCENLINARRLGHYMRNHKTMLATACGLVDIGTQQNRQFYKIISPTNK